MDTGRFHSAINALQAHLSEKKVQSRIQNLMNVLQSLISNPSDQSQANTFKTQLQELTEELQSAQINFASQWMQKIFLDIGAMSNVGRGLAGDIAYVVASNQFSTSLTLQELTKVNTRVAQFEAEVTVISTGLKKLQVPSEDLRPGESEISVMLPVKPGTKTLKDLSCEARQWHTALSHIAEVFDSDAPPLTVRTLASGSWLFYLYATPPVLYGISLCIKGVNQILRDLLTSKGLLEQLKKFQVPQDAIEKIEKDNEEKLERQLRELAERIVDENYKNNSLERKAELKNAMSQAITTLAHKLAEGAAVDLLLSPPTKPLEVAEGAETEQDIEQNRLVEEAETIQAELTKSSKELILNLPPDDVVALLPQYPNDE